MTDDSKEKAELIAHFRARVLVLTNTLENFKKNVGGDSWSLSMERSYHVFQAAARVDIFNKVIEVLSEKKRAPSSTTSATLSTIRKFAEDEVLRRATRPRCSTSPTANIMDQEDLAAWAEVLSAIKQGV